MTQLFRFEQRTVVVPLCPKCGGDRTLVQWTTAAFIHRQCQDPKCGHRWRYPKDAVPKG